MSPTCLFLLAAQSPERKPNNTQWRGTFADAQVSCTQNASSQDANVQMNAGICPAGFATGRIAQGLL
jgi:hypothetical protein